MSQTPSIGRIVHYKLAEQDAALINKRRVDYTRQRGLHWPDMDKIDNGSQAHVGNAVKAGDVYPAMVVRTWDNTSEPSVQLQVFLDGNDTFWATSVSEGDGERCWSWPPRV